MKFKIFFLILIIALGTLAYFGYPIIKNRYFGNKTVKINNEPIQQESNQQSQNNTEKGVTSNTIGITVLPFDCDNECANFQKSEELKYCKQVCEIPETNPEGEIIQPNATDCTNASGLQKDYCLKDSAIKNKDYKACDQISDAGVKKTCKNRITEDIIESQ